MPTVLTLRLRPSRPWQPDTKQVHGLACALFEQSAADHAAQGKRFAVWPVAPDPADPHVGLVLRCAWLGTGSSPVDAKAISRLRLVAAPCVLIDVDEQPASYPELAAGPPASVATLTLGSPTYFSRSGVDSVVPDPRLILGSHQRRWNEALPEGSALRIGEELWQRLHRAVRLAAFDLHTAEMDSGRGYPRAGFVGAATLQVARGAPVDVRSAFATLVRYATYCGTGAQTTHGFGATTGAVGTGSAPGG
jgi:hypothetical protein